MSYQLETLNKEKVENFGFSGPDVSKVMLGELPPISLKDFCHHAPRTLIIAMDGANGAEREAIGEIIDDNFKAVSKNPVRPDYPKSLRLETIDSLIGALARIEPEHQLARPFKTMIDALEHEQDEEVAEYPEDMFRIENSHIMIGGKYEMTITEFAHLTTYVLAGGWLGWGEKGIPKIALDALTQMKETTVLLRAA